MNMKGIFHRLIWFSWMAVSIAADEMVTAQVPGSCEVPVSERNSDVGCYLSASNTLDQLPRVPLFWHLYNYPTRAAAESAKGAHGTAVESFGRIWLYNIAGAEWRPSSGERVAKPKGLCPK
jgi:hypothetical protein